MKTILRFVSVSLKKNRNWLTWVLVALTVCFTYPVLYRISSESRACEWELWVIDNEKSWSLRADARRRIILYYQTLKSACRKPDLSLSGLDPVSLSKIETHLLASLGSTGKNRNSLACLRNAGFHSAVTYCKQTSHGPCWCGSISPKS